MWLNKFKELNGFTGEDAADFDKYITVGTPVRARGGKNNVFLNFWVAEIILKDSHTDGDTIYNDRFYMKKGAPIYFC